MSKTSSSAISAVILAAGSSRRLGTSKQLLELGGKPILQHVIDEVASCGFAEVLIVLGHRAGDIEAAVSLPDGARIVVNPDHLAGQSSSLRCGLGAVEAGSRAAAIFLGDQPRIDARSVAEVLQAFASSSKPVARATYRGTPGHPVVVAREAYAQFGGASGDEGARAFLERSEDVVLVGIDADPPIDVDTWQDFEALES